MSEHTFRPRAAIKHWAGRVPGRFIVISAVVLATALAVGATVEVTPAKGGTSAKYQRLWDGLSDRNKRWARRTSRCESGGDRNIHGGGGSYHGAFQFMLGTWRNAPKSPGGDPHRYTRRTQSVVAVYLKKRDGAKNHWPHCG
jgi:hypothetical protein